MELTRLSRFNAIVLSSEVFNRPITKLQSKKTLVLNLIGYSCPCMPNSLLQCQVSLRYIYLKYNCNASNIESKVPLMHQTASRLVHPVAVWPRAMGTLLGCLEERENVGRPTTPGLTFFSFSARQPMVSSPSVVCL